LDNIRLGDNVVWRVSDLKEFHYFLDPYLEQAILDRRNIIYVRFASHPPLVEDRPEIKTMPIELSHRFENFTVEIHNLIEREGKDAFYVFDCLSELQTAWSTDLMMGNFFRVTCPFLFILDTVAFFPIIRGKHSQQAIGRIQDTTQLFLDVYSYGKSVYVRPEKVWNRNSETMFLPHRYDVANGTMEPLLDGIQASRFYQVMNRVQRPGDEQSTDYWDRFFNLTRQMYEMGADVTDACSRMCRIMMTRDEKMRDMIRQNFGPMDYFFVRDRMIGTGMIGGKACGMLLARKIIENRRPDIFDVMEPHDSWFIGSDVYYSYIVENGLWDMRIRQRRDEEYFSLAGEFAEKLKTGRFSRQMEERFCLLLEYYGQDPVIVRSSSILEDGFGNAFAGKYESVFCANSGSLEDRLEEFENAIREVYASTMSLSALDYRKRRGLAGRDEQMALLVQRVSGSHYGKYYMPCAAGVGYSYSTYRFQKDMDPAAGILRLVMGLGTSAVDRTEGSYPRLVHLDRPEATNFTTAAERHQFSQRKLEVINKETRSLERLTLGAVEPNLPMYLKNVLLEHDYEVEQLYRERGQRRDVYFISCKGLVGRKDMMRNLQEMMQVIQGEYGQPVDIEFTLNVARDGEYMVNLLQCRPLQAFEDTGEAFVPEEIPEEAVLLHSEGASMGMSRVIPLDLILYVDPIAYYNLPYAKKDSVARAVGAINWKYRGAGKHMMLIVPGRVGTTSPELGVPTTFADISEFEVICEVSVSGVGYNPELSYGSHIFQDLVEAEILYTAVFEDEHTKAYHPWRLGKFPDMFSELLNEYGGLEGVVRVLDVSGGGCKVYNDLHHERLYVT
ncbi:MAG: PEP/pyruvate-binding domain-containing protein, partial [Lachnospiraceae bacterium]|nr:PEP/pyruvate-binding domain-containing protein [Lachnospiraceae bacterium]